MKPHRESSPIPDQVIEVLKTNSIGYLSVLSKKGELYSYPLAFHFSGMNIYFMTPVSAAKFKIIKGNPSVSFLVDNGKVTTEACGAMIQGKARIFTVGRTLLSILSLGPKMVGFSRKYPGMLTFYARGKETPDERKLYKYRLIRVTPSKVIYWQGYTVGRYLPADPIIGEGDSLELSKDEEGVGVAAKLLQSADVDIQPKPILANHDWLAKLEETVQRGTLSDEELEIIRSYRSGFPSETLRKEAKVGVTAEERKLLKKSKAHEASS